MGRKKSSRSTKNDRRYKRWHETNQHHITPRSRGGPGKHWNLITNKIVFMHKNWHHFTSCLVLGKCELMSLMPHWITKQKRDRVRDEILGNASKTHKARELKRFRENYDLVPTELITLIRECYADDSGRINYKNKRIKGRQRGALRKMFKGETDINRITALLEASWQDYMDRYPKEWSNLTCSLTLQLKEILVLLPIWFKNDGISPNEKVLSRKKLRLLDKFRRKFNLRPDETIILLENCWSDDYGHVDIPVLSGAQKEALRDGLFYGEQEIERITEIILDEWMSEAWIKHGNCLI